MPPTTALGRILVARSFVCPTNWWASCYYFLLSLASSLFIFLAMATALSWYTVHWTNFLRMVYWRFDRALLCIDWCWSCVGIQVSTILIDRLVPIPICLLGIEPIISLGHHDFTIMVFINMSTRSAQIGEPNETLRLAANIRQTIQQLLEFLVGYFFHWSRICNVELEQ